VAGFAFGQLGAAAAGGVLFALVLNPGMLTKKGHKRRAAALKKRLTRKRR
jgi:hypothetical protein